METSLKKLRILYLEDDPQDLELSIANLTEYGFEFELNHIETRKDFIACLDQPDYDLILADYNLPSFDGLTALNLFIERDLNIPFILVSGTLGEETAIESLKSGATDYVMKSRLSRLGPAVDRALQEKEEKRQRKLAEQSNSRLLKQQTAANQLSLSLGELNKLTEIYPIIYNHVKELMDARAFIISSFDNETQLIQARFVINREEVLDVSDFPSIPLAEEGQGTQSQVIRAGEPLYIPDYRKQMALTKFEYSIADDGKLSDGPPPQEDQEDSTNSAIYVPMKIEGKVIGVLQVQSNQLDAYTQEDVQLLSALANTAALAIQNTHLLEDTRRNVARLHALRSIDQAISGTISKTIILDVVLEQVITQLEVDATDVLLYREELVSLEFSRGRGFRTNGFQGITMKLGEGRAGSAALKRKLAFVPDLFQDESKLSRSRQVQEEAFVSYCGVPLIVKGNLIGVLEVFHRSELNPDQDWFDFLNTLANQAAIGIDNADLFTNLQKANHEVFLAYDSTLEGWAKALELRDMETQGHCQRVVDLTMKIARELGIKGQNLVNVRRGALLHDIGKMGIPDSILQKPGPLSDEEWEIMRQHPRYAHEWLSEIPFLQKALDVPLYHHERWDGSGYPKGLKGEQIPLPARIFALVDVWDALCSDRPYRKAWPEEQVLKHIWEQTGKHFDPQIVETFMKVIARKPGLR